MFKTTTKDLFKILNGISNGVIIKYPVTTMVSLSKQIVVNIDMKKLEEEFETFGLLKLNEFIQLLEFFDTNECDLNLKKGVITLKNNKTTQKYLTTNLERLSMFDFPFEYLERLKDQTPVSTFKITKTDIEDIKKIHSILKLPDLSFSGVDNEVIMKIIDISDESKNETEIKINDVVKTSDNFETSIKIENILKIPTVDYEINIYKNSKGMFVTRWTPSTLPIDIMLSVNYSN